MWIRQLEIEGFGTWSQESFRLGPGLNVFLGPNEAGKSTLLNFIRAILFGFERRGQASRYEPVSGDTHGGRILLETELGNFVVERLGGTGAPSSGRVTIIDAAGNRFGEELLSNLLGGVSRELFYSVFAFGLGELEQLDSLNRADVNGVIFSAGIDTPVPIVEVERTLQAAADELFRTRASKPVINQGLVQLEELYQEIQDLSNQPAAYRSLVTERARLRKEIDIDAAQRKKLLSDLAWVQTLVGAWDTWQELCQVQAELDELPVVENFPVQGEARLEELSQLLEEQTTNLESQATLLAANEARLANLSQGRCLAKHRSEVIDLIERRSAHLQNADRYKAQVGVVAQCKKAVEQRLTVLGSGWTVEKVEAVQGGLEIKEAIRSMQRELKELELSLRDSNGQLQQAEAKVQEAAEQVANLKERIKSIEAEIASLNPGYHSYETRRQAFDYFSSAREQIRTLETKLDHLKASIEDLNRQLQALQTKGNFAWQPLQRLLHVAGVGMAVVIAAVVFGLLGYGNLALPFGMVGGTLVIGGLGMRSFLKNQVRIQAETAQADGREIEKQLRMRTTDYQSTLQALKEWREKAAEAALICFGHSAPKEEEIIACREALDTEKDLRTTWQTLQSQLQEAEKRLKTAEDNKKLVQAQLAEAEENWTQALRNWKAWLQEHGLETNLTPDGALDVIDGVMSAVEAIRKFQEEETAQRNLEKQLAAYCERVNRLRELCGEEPVTYDLAPVVVLDFKSILEEYDKLCEKVQQQRETVATLREQVEVTEKKLSDLLQAAGATDAEEFRRLGAVYKRRQELQQRLRDLKVDLTSRSAERGFEAICSDLSQTNAAMLNERLKLLDEQVAALEGALAQKQVRIGEINQEIANLEQDQRRSAQQFAYDTLQEEMNEAAKRWATLVIAKELITLTRQRYEKTRQPDVLRQASEYFAKMTSGRYRRVFTPFGEQVIRVEAANHSYLTVDQLSRGTVEQLYLAMRFALIREFAKRSVVLPVIMDDILVNFDPVRLEQTAAVIRELAEEHQVLFFSCHPHVAAALQGSSQQGTVIELGSYVA